MIPLGWSLILAVWLTGVAALGYRIWSAVDRGAPASRRHRLALATMLVAVGATVSTCLALQQGVGSDRPALQGLLGRHATLPRLVPRFPAAEVPAALPFTFDTLINGIVVGWMFGVAILGGRLVGGLILASRIRRKAAPVSSPAVHAPVLRPGSRGRLSRAIDVLETDEVDAPVTLGWVRPAILLPRSLLFALPGPALEALLAHEVAHARAYDYPINFVQSVVELLLFHCPSMRWLSREARLAREQARDDDAVRACANRELYACALGRLAEVCLKAQARMAPGAAGPSLVGRIRRLLEGESMSKPSAAQWGGLGAGLLVLAFTGAVVASTAASHAARSIKVSRAAFPAIPRSYGAAQGSPVEIEGVTSSTDIVFAAVRVRNTMRHGRVTGIVFAQLIEAGHDLRVIEASETATLPVSLGPSETAELPLHALPVQRVRKAQQEFGRAQASLAVTAVELSGGSRWTAPLREGASTVQEATRQAPPRLSRTSLARPGDPRAQLCLDDDHSEYSEGAIVPLLGEEGHFACCRSGGTWRECSAPGP
jgi:beta-lactamase regulating signal transducer with metallopeptidase domain